MEAKEKHFYGEKDFLLIEQFRNKTERTGQKYEIKPWAEVAYIKAGLQPFIPKKESREGRGKNHFRVMRAYQIRAHCLITHCSDIRNIRTRNQALQIYYAASHQNQLFNFRSATEISKFSVINIA